MHSRIPVQYFTSYEHVHAPFWSQTSRLCAGAKPGHACTMFIRCLIPLAAPKSCIATVQSELTVGVGKNQGLPDLINPHQRVFPYLVGFLRGIQGVTNPPPSDDSFPSSLPPLNSRLDSSLRWQVVVAKYAVEPDQGARTRCISIQSAYKNAVSHKVSLIPALCHCPHLPDLRSSRFPPPSVSRRSGCTRFVKASYGFRIDDNRESALRSRRRLLRVLEHPNRL